MKRGEGGEFVAAGKIAWDSDGIPVNTSGGHLSEAYMQGMNQLLEGVRQVRGESTAQVKDVEVSFVDTGVGVGAAIFTKEP
jgi:acetyl-CoA acetyltransferase